MEKVCQQIRSIGKLTGVLIISAAVVFLVACSNGLQAKSEHKPQANILIYTKNGKGFVHENIPASVECLKKICTDNGWNLRLPMMLRFLLLKRSKPLTCLFFPTPTTKHLTPKNKKRFFRNIFATAAALSAFIRPADRSEQWPWFWANLGGKFVRHPKFQPFTMKVIDQNTSFDRASGRHVGSGKMNVIF